MYVLLWMETEIGKLLWKGQNTRKCKYSFSFLSFFIACYPGIYFKMFFLQQWWSACQTLNVKWFLIVHVFYFLAIFNAISFPCEIKGQTPDWLGLGESRSGLWMLFIHNCCWPNFCPFIDKKEKSKRTQTTSRIFIKGNSIYIHWVFRI